MKMYSFGFNIVYFNFNTHKEITCPRMHLILRACIAKLYVPLRLNKFAKSYIYTTRLSQRCFFNSLNIFLVPVLFLSHKDIKCTVTNRST